MKLIKFWHKNAHPWSSTASQALRKDLVAMPFLPKLSQLHLEQPIWEFALDEVGEYGQDEATVRPFDGCD